MVRTVWALLTEAERRQAVGIFGLTFIGMMLETLGVSLVIPVLTLLAQPDFEQAYPVLQPVLHALGDPTQQALVLYGMVMLVVVYVIKTTFLTFLAWRQMRFAFGVQAQISQRLFGVYLRQPYTFHLQRNSAQLIRNVMNEVNVFTFNGMLPGLMLLTESLVLLGLCILLLIVEPVGAVAVLSVLGAAAWIFYRSTRGLIARWGEARQYHEGCRIQHLQQGLGGAKDVKLLGRETEFLEQYDIHNAGSARVGQLQATMQQLPRLWLEMLAVGGLAILVLSMLIQGRAPEAVLPTLGLFAVAAFRLMPSVTRLINAMQALRYGVPVVNILHQELGLVVPGTNATIERVSPLGECLELRRVGYLYPQAPDPALSDVSLTVRRGESVGLIGTSGAGKSTLVDVLLGLLTPSSGAVYVDGKDIREGLRNWQDQIGYVPQSIFLTDDSLRRNVAFGVPSTQIDHEAVARAIKAAQLEEFVRGLPSGLDASMGERGVRLSGGERQRIGIARALYHDPNILVLDEATSSLDLATEESIMQAVRALQGKKTIIIVAHRLSTVAHCDRLYRLERGRVVEAGPPRNLLLKEAGK